MYRQRNYKCVSTWDFYKNLNPEMEFGYMVYLKIGDNYEFQHLEKIARKSTTESDLSCAIRVLRFKGYGYRIFDLNGKYLVG